MARRLLLAATAALVIGASGAAAFAADVPANIAAAVADASRPADDKARDADRKPAEMLAFAGVKPGDKVVDFIAGKGYFTKLFSAAVGPKGVVYKYAPTEFAQFSKTPLPANGAPGDPDRKNVIFLTSPANSFTTPEPVDIVWTSQNYHDLHDSFAKPADLALVNKAIFNALKPGGVYVVLDHAAAPGSGLAATETLHRIDPAVVKSEVEAAGFKFEGESDVLANPADDHTKKVFDPAIRGKTDQFVFKFRKPG
ncbi:class I SAM-dependent methyltransferase [Phenylobacterium montanum]|uniref:Class I SAM-dependent methyltransferase n=1 Tax=Phenylobacterium montanum TaxID=2823693 RepID=A0A975G117_9CAUL|nr:class I SAM-dependent methyltransferase [Caulobacter sp. S6]QUD88791.1 class I SAM-dependent methyltransferase [Caulobacter sp. S6]